MGDDNVVPLGNNGLIVIQDRKVAMISRACRPVTVEIKYKKSPEMSFYKESLLKSIKFETDGLVFTDHPHSGEIIKKVDEIFKLLRLKQTYKTQS